MGPTNSTVTGTHKGQDLRFDALTKSVVNRPLELVPNKMATVELTHFLQDRRARLIKDLQSKVNYEDMKEMEKYMTRQELEQAFQDIGQYSDPANVQDGKRETDAITERGEASEVSLPTL